MISIADYNGEQSPGPMNELDVRCLHINPLFTNATDDILIIIIIIIIIFIIVIVIIIIIIIIVVVVVFSD